MSNSKSKQNNKRKTRQRPPRRSQASGDTARGLVGMPTTWPGSSAALPGRAHVRLVTEVFPTPDKRAFSATGFSTWSSHVDNILSSYQFFRIASADVEVVVSGGAASTYSVAFNVSNASNWDSNPVAVLNDDYAGVATAMVRPKLSTPKAYWDGRSQPWYSYLTDGSTDFKAPTCVAGMISLNGSGASETTVIGYLVADLVVEFHTLV
nr:hypothetical protein [Tolivirales sp.]